MSPAEMFRALVAATDPTLAKLGRVVARKRRLHPELGRYLSWRGLQRILAREQVGLFVVPLPRPAQLVRYDGAWAVLVDAKQPPRRQTYWGAHELAHLWLHVDEAEGRDARVFTYDDYREQDPREDEAELLATWLLGSRAIRSPLAAYIDAADYDEGC